jgi:G3E family GTPase
MIAIPVTLIGGYLGAGKTTLINSLLRASDGRRIAVLVNDFGALPIDADLVDARDGNVIAISGGCICCSFGNDLVAALIELVKSGRRIDHIVIETSGVALPETIASSISLIQTLVLDGVIVIADAETVREYGADRYIGDTVLRQLIAADLIVLNKADLVSPAHLAAAQVWLEEVAPGAKVLPTSHANLPPSVVLGPYDQVNRPARSWQLSPHSTSIYRTAEFDIGGSGDAETLARALAASRLGLLRAKGIVDHIDGSRRLLQVVGRRALVELAPPWIEGPGRLQCIGLASVIDLDALLEVLVASPFSVVPLR